MVCAEATDRPVGTKAPRVLSLPVPSSIRELCGTLSGPGRLISPTPSTIVYRGPARAGSATVTATAGCGGGSITFTIIEPDSITMRRHGVREQVDIPFTQLAPTCSVSRLGLTIES